MIKSIYRVLLVGILSGQLIFSGCVTTATIKRPAYEPFLRSKPIDDKTLNKIHAESPKDAVFADLLQAFALMRSADITNQMVRNEILDLLETSVSSFEDMSDPVNFSQAFTADEDKPFRGYSYDRMFTSMTAGVLLLAENKCAQAMPYFRNAEFLDARFQKMPFGTDAPLVYALMYRCLVTQNAAKTDIARAADGVFRSVRFLTMQEPLIDALKAVAQVDMRPLAIAHRLAYMIFEISIYHSLISASNHFDSDALIDDAAKNASLFISSLSSHFEDEYKARMLPSILELADVYGLDKKTGQKHLEELAFQRVGLESKVIGEKLKAVFKHHAQYKSDIHEAHAKTKELSEKILAAASAEKMILSFLGRGPTIVREGAYDEISVIKPSPEGSTEPAIRQRNLKINPSCGFHRSDTDGGFSVVLCKPSIEDKTVEKIVVMPTLELLSLSRKATTIQGRKFDKILKGRAQFRAATEKIAEISAWSALFLFYLGSTMMSDCSRQGQSQSCYAKGLAVWTLAAITGVFSGTVWLIGRAKNPAADSRYIHLMYESVMVVI